jgi:hypothetical protein
MPIASSSSGTEWQRPSMMQVTEMVASPPSSDDAGCPRGLLTVPTPPQVHLPGGRRTWPPTASSLSLSDCIRKGSPHEESATLVCTCSCRCSPLVSRVGGEERMSVQAETTLRSKETLGCLRAEI